MLYFYCEAGPRPTQQENPQRHEQPPDDVQAGMAGTQAGVAVTLQALGMLMSTILVVDDDVDFLTALRALLESERYQVMTATNGAGALIAAHEHKPELVLTDWMMPVMDGAELCRHMKDDPDLCNVPTVLWSAAGVPPALTVYWEKTLRKPVRFTLLTDLLRNLLAAPH
jgi:CheY-like chemotaxis protein